MYGLTQLTPHLRPRERLHRHGPSALTDTELVALVIGHGSRGRDALSVADELLRSLVTLEALVDADPVELHAVAGIGPVTAARLAASVELGKRALWGSARKRPAIHCATDVHRLMRPAVAGLAKETFWALAVNARHGLLRRLRVAEGTLVSVDVHPREVFRPLIRLGAAGAILVHNHPSGDPTPSSDDIALTHRLGEVGALTGIPILDHVVVTVGGYVSLAESGCL